MPEIARMARSDMKRNAPPLSAAGRLTSPQTQRLLQLRQGPPQLPLPIHHARLLALPAQQAMAWPFILCSLSRAQAWDHGLGDPLADAAVFRVIEVDQRGVQAGFADQLHGFSGLVFAENRHSAYLVRIEIFADTLFQEGMHQLRQVVHDEPRLAFDQKGAEAAFVAVEGGGDEWSLGCGKGHGLGVLYVTLHANGHVFRREGVFSTMAKDVRKCP